MQSEFSRHSPRHLSAHTRKFSTQSFRTADASDASFLTPARLNTIRLLVEHPNISLHVLNAPEDAMDGVTPLGVAAWLNAPEVVRILLDTGAGAVSANGLDTHRATPLMCKSMFLYMV